MAKSIKRRLTLAGIERFTLPEDRNEMVVWDTVAHHLGVRHRRGRSPAFIFTCKFAGKTVRLSLGNVSSITLEQARKETARLNALVAQGIDPREDKRRRKAEEETARRERERAAATFGALWDDYIRANEERWSDHHRVDHERSMQEPGIPCRGRKTVAGVLWPLRTWKLAETAPQRLQEHFAKEAARRPTTTAKAFRHFRAALRWGRLQPDYEGLYDVERLVAAAGKPVQKSATPKTDALQREQLAPWFRAVQVIPNPLHRAYLQALLLTGARPGELLSLRWEDVDLQWNTLTIRDKVEGERTIPLTPYVRQLLQGLPKRNAYVFSTGRTDGPMDRPGAQHRRALESAGLPNVTLHGLRRSFGSLAEWVEVPAGIVAQIQGHKPRATVERHYRVRPVDLLRMWHSKIEAWILDQAGLHQPEEDGRHLEAVQ